MPPVSDLVRDSKLETTFCRGYTQHVYHVSGFTPRQRKMRKEERWVRSNNLGSGGFGTVWLEKLVAENGEEKYRAVKEIRKRVQRSKTVDYSRELEAIAKFSHQRYEMCFAKSFGWYESDECVFIAMEYFPLGDLQSYLSSLLSEKEAQQIASQILEGLSFMHDNGFAHRDLKPTNILVKSIGPDWWVKIGDFGISKRAEEGLTALRTLNGTPGFLAPEILLQLGLLDDNDLEISKGYTVAIDIWALGEIIFRALTGEQPFPIKSLRAYIKGTSPFPAERLQAQGVSKEGCDFLKSLMAAMPKDRLTATDALSHIWIEPQKPPSARVSAEMQRLDPTTEGAIPSPEYPTTEASARWSTATMTQLHRDHFEGAERRAHNLRNDKKANLADALAPSATGYDEDLRHHSEVEALSVINPNQSDKSSPSPYHALTSAAAKLTPGALRRWVGLDEPKSYRTLKGHSGRVWAVAFSPDGKTLASASYDKTVRLWDSATGAARRTLKGHWGPVWAVAFSPDGKTLASASYDKTVRLWDSATGAARRTLEGHWGPVWAVAFSPDGKTLASASYDKTVRLWDSATGAARRTLEGHSGMVGTVAFSPDGKTLASASYDKTVRLWDSATGAARRTLEGHSGMVGTVAFSPDGKTLASASYDKTVRLWDSATGAARRTLEGHSGMVGTVAFSPDGKTLASASYDKTVRLWDSATGAARRTLEGHSDWVGAVAFSPDGKTLASASHDKTVRLWDSATGAARRTLEGHSDWVGAVAFSPDGKTLASASYDKTVRLWDSATGAARRTLEGHSGSVRAVAFSPDGKTLASASSDKTIRLWDSAKIFG